ncbi:MAG: hypothetical protein RIB60_02180 [Phycisphaerales bacterium]
MTPDPGQSAPVCPECGTPPGGPVMPRRWVWWRRAAVLASLIAWTALVGSLVSRSSRAVMSFDPRWGHVYTCSAVDSWLDQAANSDGDWWVREVVARSWAAGYPVPADEPLEIAVVGNSVTANATPWAPSSLTMGRVMSGEMSDREFARLAHEDLERHFGPEWDGPGQTNIAWRAAMSPSFEGEIRRVPPLFGLAALAQYQEVSIPDYRGRELAWARPPRLWRDGWLTLRSDDMSVTGNAWVLEIRTPQVWALLALLVAAAVLAWTLAPPIWWRLTRRRRRKTARCLECGYPLPGPSP